ncbi:MAG: hypothetical protein QM673_10790 [Gordonia sp. (in: high G+C Gram-positive bacteria)]
MTAGKSGSGDRVAGYDLNGRPIAAGRWDRLRRVVTRRDRDDAGIAGVGDRELIVVAQSYDDAIASSVALAESAWQPQAQAVVCHLLAVPADAISAVCELAGLDGYQPVYPVDIAPTKEGDSGHGDRSIGEGVVVPAGLTLVVLARVQLLDPLHLSQERSRMASLASRHRGVPIGWQVLQHPR